MMAANNSLKNNRNLLSKRKEKNSLSGSYRNVEMIDFPKATPQELKRIREKIQRENKQTEVKQWIVFVILMVIIVSILI